jgi:hypothetical protein
VVLSATDAWRQGAAVVNQRSLMAAGDGSFNSTFNGTEVGEFGGAPSQTKTSAIQDRLCGGALSALGNKAVFEK